MVISRKEFDNLPEVVCKLCNRKCTDDYYYFINETNSVCSDCRSEHISIPLFELLKESNLIKREGFDLMQEEKDGYEEYLDDKARESQENVEGLNNGNQ